MKKLFFAGVLLAILVIASGCVQQQSGGQAGNQANNHNNPQGSSFQRQCTTDADCALPQQGQRPQGDLNSFRDSNSRRMFDQNNFGFDRNSFCGNDQNCLQRIQQDFNRMRDRPELKCVSGYCQPVFGDSNAPQ